MFPHDHIHSVEHAAEYWKGYRSCNMNCFEMTPGNLDESRILEWYGQFLQAPDQESTVHYVHWRSGNLCPKYTADYAEFIFDKEEDWMFTITDF
jgi:hypothetical protein